MKRTIVVVQAGLWLFILAAYRSPEDTSKPKSRDFEFIYETWVREIPKNAGEFCLWIPLAPETPEQRIKDFRIESDLPYRLVRENKHGNRAVFIRAQSPPETLHVRLRFRVKRYEHLSHALANGASLPSDEIAVSPLWLQGDRLVPIDGTIRKWAQETVAGKVSDLEKARAIYDYVVENLKYDKSGTAWGRGDIYYACDAKRGNCSDFHAIFIGFARAVGIPSKFEIGFPLPEARGQGEIFGYHCWAQFYLNGYGWIPVDASEANKNPSKRDYFFGAHDANRILFSVGRDLVFEGQKDEALNFFIYPHAELNGKVYERVEKRFYFKDES